MTHSFPTRLSSDRGKRRAGDAARRPSLFDPAPPVVELRQLVARPHQRRQARLEGRQIPARPRRQRRIYPAARNAENARLSLTEPTCLPAKENLATFAREREAGRSEIGRAHV